MLTPNNANVFHKVLTETQRRKYEAYKYTQINNAFLDLHAEGICRISPSAYVYFFSAWSVCC